MKILLLVLLLAIAMPCFPGIDSLGGYAWTPVTKTYSTSGTVSGAIVWTPESGRKIVLLGAMLGSNGDAGNSTTIEVETGFDSAFKKDGTDVIPPVNIASGQVVISGGVPIWQGNTDEKLSITANTPVSPSVVLWGYETN